MIHGCPRNANPALIWSTIVDSSFGKLNLMPITNILKKHIINQLQRLQVQVHCLLCKKMALHAIDIEQPVLLGRFAPGTLQTADGLHTGRTATGRCINRVARLESIERRVSCEE
jgi:hypothetical protein